MACLPKRVQANAVANIELMGLGRRVCHLRSLTSVLWRSRKDVKAKPSFDAFRRWAITLIRIASIERFSLTEITEGGVFFSRSFLSSASSSGVQRFPRCTAIYAAPFSLRVCFMRILSSIKQLRTVSLYDLKS